METKSSPSEMVEQDHGRASKHQQSFSASISPSMSKDDTTVDCHPTATRSWNNIGTSNPTHAPHYGSSSSAGGYNSLYSLFHLPSFGATDVNLRDSEVEIVNTSMRMDSSCRRYQHPTTDPAEASFHIVDFGGGVDDNGVRLTWDCLSVTVPDRRSPGRWRAILDGITGYAVPGRILALMGPSGCGKSTLLDFLAGRLSSKVKLCGNILVNGRQQALAFGTSAYVTQEDVLLTTLTVREAVYYAAQLQLPESMPKREKLQRADDTIREMGLKDAADTRIGGGPRSRGLSGGQRRRVSICLEILTRPSLLFLDEPTSGLDSAASFHVMQRIAALGRRHGQTVVVSLHQPSSEVFGLLDDLYLLTQGKTVYFGPATEASEFFASNGFPCPYLMNPPDHYLKTINKNFELEDDEQNGYSEVPTTSVAEAINILVSSYKASSYSANVVKRVREISAVEGRKLAKGSQAGFVTQCLVLTQRSSVNMLRDAGYYWLRMVIYLGIAFVIGTIYNNLDYSYKTIAERMSVLVFISGFITFMTIGGFPSFVEDLKVFGGERLNGHYGVVAYVVSHTLSSLPFIFLNSIVPGVVTYYMVGLRKNLSHFSYFILLLFMLLLLVESLMMVVAAIVPNYLLGIISGAGLQAVLLLVGGFFQLPDYIPNVVWKYPCHYISFQKYGNQGFSKNEYIGLTFDNKDGGPGLTGLEVIRDMYQMQVGYSKWIDLTIVFGMVVVYRLLFLAVIKFNERILPVVRCVRFTRSKQSAQIVAQPATPTRLVA